MNKKIIFCVVFSFIISFSLLLVILNYFPDEQILKEQLFYSKDFPLNNKIIFLLGSSHVGQLNSTLIHEAIQSRFSEYDVYNLSYVGDNPSKRIQTIDKIINLNPKIVLYGISYRDFQVEPIKESILPDPQQFFNDFFVNELGINNAINPKFITLEIIRKNFSYVGLLTTHELIQIHNSPFFTFYPDQTIILKDEELKQRISNDVNEIQTLKNKNVTISNERVSDFYQIIEKFQKNGTEVIIFSTPLHQYAIDQISLELQYSFSMMLENTKNTYKVKIYDFSDKYVKENIWANLDHISYNKKSNIYSEDIAKIIVKEIEK